MNKIKKYNKKNIIMIVLLIIIFASISIFFILDKNPNNKTGKSYDIIEPKVKKIDNKLIKPFKNENGNYYISLRDASGTCCRDEDDFNGVVLDSFGNAVGCYGSCRVFYVFNDLWPLNDEGKKKISDFLIYNHQYGYVVALE